MTLSACSGPISHSGRKGTSWEPQNQGHDHWCYTFDMITTLLSCTISTWFCSSRWETTDNQITFPAMLMCECVFLPFRLLYILHWRACVTFYHDAKYSNLPQITYRKWIVSLKKIPQRTICWFHITIINYKIKIYIHQMTFHQIIWSVCITTFSDVSIGRATPVAGRLLAMWPPLVCCQKSGFHLPINSCKIGIWSPNMIES